MSTRPKSPIDRLLQLCAKPALQCGRTQRFREQLEEAKNSLKAQHYAQLANIVLEDPANRFRYLQVLIGSGATLDLDSIRGKLLPPFRKLLDKHEDTECHAKPKPPPPPPPQPARQPSPRKRQREPDILNNIACGELGYLSKLVLELKCLKTDLDRKVESQGRDYDKELKKEYNMESYPIDVMLINQAPGSADAGRNPPPRPVTLHIHEPMIDGERIRCNGLDWEPFNYYVKPKTHCTKDVWKLRQIVEEVVQEVYKEWCVVQGKYLEQDYSGELFSRLSKKLDSSRYCLFEDCRTAKGGGSRKRADIVIWDKKPGQQ